MDIIEWYHKNKQKDITGNSLVSSMIGAFVYGFIFATLGSLLALPIPWFLAIFVGLVGGIALATLTFLLH